MVVIVVDMVPTDIGRWRRVEENRDRAGLRASEDGIICDGFFSAFLLSAFPSSAFSMSKSSKSKSWRDGPGGGVEFCCWDYVLLPNSIDLGIFHGYQSSIVALYSVVQRHTSTP